MGAAIVAFSSGVWATHFIGVLAYRPGIPFGFNVPLCVLSYVLAIGATALAFMPGRRSETTPTAIVARGLILALGIVAMHFAGMLALEVPARLHYQPDLVGAALRERNGARDRRDGTAVARKPDSGVRGADARGRCDPFHRHGSR